MWPAGSMTFSNRRIIAYADFLKVVFKFVQNMKRLAHKDSEEDDDVILLIPFSEKSGNRPQAREVSVRCGRTNSFFVICLFLHIFKVGVHQFFCAPMARPTLHLPAKSRNITRSNRELVFAGYMNIANAWKRICIQTI